MNLIRVMHRSPWAILSTVTICLLAACTPAPAVPAPASTARLVPQGWVTFDDPLAPFTLSYPEDVHFTGGQSKQGIYTARLQFRLPGVEGYQGMLIRVEPNQGGKGIEAVAGDLYRRYSAGEPPASLVEDAQELLVSGQAGVRLEGFGGSAEDFTIVVPYGEQVFIVAPVHGMAGIGPDPRALELFNRILGTLEVRP